MKKPLHLFSIVVLGAFFLAACASTPEPETKSFTTERLATGYEVHGDGGNFLVGPQLSSEDFKELKATTDVDLIINLRSASENRKVPFDQWQLAQRLGLEYHQIPLLNKGTLNPKSIDRIEALLQKRPGKKVLVYCASGNRAAAWYSLHKAANTPTNSEQALTLSHKMGLKNRKLKGILTAYLSKAGLVDDDFVLEDESAKLQKNMMEETAIIPMPQKEEIIEVEDSSIETDDPMML